VRILALAAALAVTAPPADAGPRPGKIVRVERPRTGSRGVPRICQLNPGDNSASCFGLPPVVGEIANVVGNEGIVGSVRITKVEEQAASSGLRASCTQGLWRAETELTVNPDLNLPNGVPYGSWILLDVQMLASGKLADPPPQLPGGQSGESAAVTVDKDGDSAADFLVTWYPCNSSSAAVTGSSQTYCVDYWHAAVSQWTKTRQDLVTWCM
jgi:hypothetical protein